jgi:NADPH2:quinone reductase
LIHGAAGGLGLAAIQIAKALRTTVIATVNSRKKRDIAMRYGADFVVDTRSADWVKEVLDLTPAKRGADVVLDPLGLISPSLACTAWNGRLVVIGFAAGSIERIPMNRVLLKNVSIAGLFWGRYQDMEPQMVTAVWDALLGLIREGKLRPTVYTEERFNGLQAVPAAMLCVQNGTAWGKVVVTVTQHAGSKL